MENNEPKNQLAAELAESQDIVSRAKANSKLILGLSVFILVVIVAIFIWFFVAKSGSHKADEAAGRADIAQNDSIALVLYKEAATKGYKSGNRAKVEAAIRLYQAGQYQEALDYLKDASIGDKVIAAGTYTLMGDCYSNLNQYAEAAKAYGKAISKADKNPVVVPIILVKQANVYRELKDYQAEYKALNTLMEDYPQFVQTSQTDFRKYFERAKAAAGK
ncbi:MAG: tetratricopeptide repeat protein [Muribaculaceae bacterium]|nr:tetratricopeptide repeat protein [Muribaculaceae bacterium]